MPGPLQRSCLEVRPTPTASREQSTKTIRPPTSPLQKQRRLPRLISLGRSAAATAAAEKPSGAWWPPAPASSHLNIIMCHYSRNQWGKTPLVHYFMWRFWRRSTLPPNHHHHLYTQGAAARQWQTLAYLQSHGNKMFLSLSLGLSLLPLINFVPRCLLTVHFLSSVATRKWIGHFCLSWTEGPVLVSWQVLLALLSWWWQCPADRQCCEMSACAVLNSLKAGGS